MTDAKNLLEDQLEASHRRIASVHDLENSLARSDQRLRDMTAVGAWSHTRNIGHRVVRISAFLI